MFWLWFFLFLFGLQLGSFINALNYRIYSEGSVFRGRSRCPKCQHVLGAKDLIPLLSFLLLKMRCRYCQEPISWRYPLVEFVAGLLLLVIWIFAANSLWAAFYSVVFLALLAVAAYDLEHYLIPDKLLLFCLLVSLVFLVWLDYSQEILFQWPSFLLSGLSSGILAFTFLGLIYWLTKGRGMGFGDVKLVFVLGLIVGWPETVVAVFLSFFIGAIIGLVLIGLGRKKMKEAVPFGPFLVLGGLLAALWGSQMIDWYFSLFT